jgi:hypothetical protein
MLVLSNQLCVLLPISPYLWFNYPLSPLPCVNKYTVLTIYAPMIYTAPCVMFLMRADALRGEVGPSEIARADRRVQFWAHFPT